MREKVAETLGYQPESNSHEDRVIITSLIVGMLQGTGANTAPLFDSNETLYGFTVEGIQFYLPIDNEKMGA